MPTRLGQNFLNDKSIIKRIVESAKINSTDFVLEIGPGKGALTEELSKKAGKVLAVEIDSNLIPDLEKKFKNQKNVEIINEDILKISKQFPNFKISNDQKRDRLIYKVVANIPYYITSKIIRLFLENDTPPGEITLMVQKEVAERIVALPGKMSLLSFSVQYYAQAKILFEVNRNCFSPVPEVDSAVIQITPTEKNRPEGETKQIFRLVKAGFSSKRKTLLNNLSGVFHLEKTVTLEKIKSAGFNENTRAQELSVSDWKKMISFF